MYVMLPDIIIFADCGTLHADTLDILLTNKFASWFQTGSLLSITSVPNKSFPIPNTTEAKHDPTMKIKHSHLTVAQQLTPFFTL